MPEEMAFKNPVHDSCSSVPENYKPNLFTTAVLQSTDVELSWEQEEAERKECLTSQAAWKNMEDEDFSQYIESESDSESDVESRKRNYRKALLGSESEGETDQEITFTPGAGTPGEDINIEPAYQRGFSGRGVRIAVSDSGVDLFHEDLFLNFLNGEHRNYSSTTPPYLGNPNIERGGSHHGTAVAGLIAAAGNNGIGIKGVAYKSKIAVFKYIGEATRTSQVVDQANGNYLRQPHILPLPGFPSINNFPP